MNRERRRNMKKELKKKFTDEQYEKISQKVVQEAVDLEVARQMRKIITHMTDTIVDVLRENRISEERTSKIINQIVDRTYESVKNGGKENDQEKVSE